MKRLLAGILGLAWGLLFWTASAWAGSLVAALPMAPAGLDPHRNLDPTAWPFIHACYHRLVTLKPGGTEPAPSLAVTWRVSEDGRLYTVVLQEGLTFSDGRPVNAEAVQYSFSRALRLEAGPVFFPHLLDIQVLGPNTLRFVLDRPWPAFPASLASAAASIVSPGVQNQPPDYLRTNTLGSGSYVIRDWIPGREIVLESRPDLPGHPVTGTWTFRFEPRPEKRLEMLCSGEVQVAELSPETAELARDEESLAVRATPSFQGRYLTFNLRRPWLDRLEIRRALASAVDYLDIVGRLGPGATQRWHAPVPVGMWGYQPEIKPYEHDLPAAVAALTVWGPPARPLQLILVSGQTDDRAMAQALVEYWAAAGVPVVPTPCSNQELNQRLVEHRFDLALMNWRPLIPAPEPWLDNLVGSGKPGGNPAGLANPDLDGLMAEINLTGDRKRRLTLLASLQEKIMAEAPYLFLQQVRVQVGMIAKIKNFSLHPQWPEVWPLEQITRGP